MKTVCGADCSKCPSNSVCKGCVNTDCKPFGKVCIASQYIKTGGIECYNEFKNQLIKEINELLRLLDVPEIDMLFELAGQFVNLPYRLPSGEFEKFLDEEKIYLGCQIQLPNLCGCVGVVADTSFILICSYGIDGSEGEVMVYKKR